MYATKKAPSEEFRTGLYKFLRNYFFLLKSTTIGVATHREEYVPTTTPMINANTNPLITSPPKKKIISNTTNVDKDVLMVLDKVEFNASLITTS